MSVPAARVLAFPGIDLETLTQLRARASDAFVRDDLTAYQDACMLIRKLIGGRDAAGARSTAAATRNAGADRSRTKRRWSPQQEAFRHPERS
jgi:hypothetical protein